MFPLRFHEWKNRYRFYKDTVVSLCFFCVLGVAATLFPENAAFGAQDSVVPVELPHPVQEIHIRKDLATLADTLLLFAQQTGEEIIFPYDRARQYPAKGLKGRYTSTGALAVLLKDTPLIAYRNAENIIIIRFDQAKARGLREKRRQRPRSSQPDNLSASLTETVELDAGDLPVEELVITGSRLERKEFVTPTPLAIISSDLIRTTGSTNVETILNKFSQVLPGLTAHSNNPGDGTVTLDLRGLGTSRTLVLVDGKRYVASNQAGIIDLNAIPTVLVKKVEIATGGTSAVYGSDAISGVVNFILKDDFQGGLLDTQYSISNAGDAEKWHADAVFGGDIAQGRGNLFLHVGYLERQALLQGERRFSSYALGDGFIVPGSADPDFGFGLPSRPSEGGVPGLIRLGSGAIPETRIIGVFPTGPYPGLERFGPQGESLPYRSEEHSFNYAPDNFLQLPQKRWMTTLGGKYEISDALRLQSRSTFVHNRVDTKLAPTPAFMGEVLVPVENPFLAEDSRAALRGLDWYGTGDIIQARNGAGELLFHADGTPVQARQALGVVYDEQGNVLSTQALWNDNGTPVVATGVPDPDVTGRLLFQADGKALIPFLGRRIQEIGTRKSLNDRDSFNTVFSFEADLSARWQWSGYYNYGHYSHEQHNINDVSEQKLRQALNIIELDGEYVCADEAARAKGCVPANIYGAGNLSPEALAYIGINTFSKTTYERQVASTQISGFLDMSWLGGEEKEPAQFLFGAEWRKESSHFKTDEAVSSGDVLGFNINQGANGSYAVLSLFGEFALPLISTGADGQKLELSGAFRYSDFQTSGVNWSYAAGVFWSPGSGISLRGQYQRAVRAPNIDELFSGKMETFSEVMDPCAARYAEASEMLVPLCEATGVPAGETGHFTQASGLIRISYSGNPNLKEEFSDTFTTGLVVRPDQFGNFQLTLDYYDITLHDRIDILAGGAANVFALCYSGNNPESPYCQAIHRLPDGNLNYLDLTLENQGKAHTNGFDLQIFYSRAVEWGLFTGGSNLDFYFQGSYVLGFRLDPAVGLQGPDCVGFFGGICGDPYPRLRFMQLTRWETGPLSLTLRWRFMGAVKDAAQLEGLRPDQLAVPDIPAQHYFDLYATYEVSEQISLRGGVDNLLNNMPEFIGSSQQQANTFPNVYDVLGPYFYMGLQLKF